MRSIKKTAKDSIDDKDYLSVVREKVRTIYNDVSNLPRQLDLISKSTDELNVYAEKIEDVGLSHSYIFEKIETEVKNIFASVQVLSESSDMSASFADKFSQATGKIIEYYGNAIENLSVIPDMIKRTGGDIADLQESFGKIKTITDEILKISKKTEETSRNAGIKAFHAGDQGKGFEVVAQEIEKLAKVSFEASENIPKIINKIDDENASLSEDINQSKEHISFIIKSVDSSRMLMNNITKETDNIVNNFNSVKVLIEKENVRKNGILDVNNKMETIAKFIVVFTSRIKNFSESATNIMEQLFIYKNAFFDLLNSSLTKDNEAERKILDSFKGFKIFKTLFENYADFQEQLDNLSKEFKSQAEELLNLTKNAVGEIEGLDGDRKMLQDISKKLKNSHTVIEKNIDDIEVESQHMIEHIDNLNKLFKSANNLLNGVNLLFKELETNTEKVKVVFKRTKILSLYAGIEAAKSGKFRSELEIIVNDLKMLSSNSEGLVKDIDRIKKGMRSTFVVTNGNSIKTLKLVDQTKELIDFAITNGKNVSSTLSQLDLLIQEVSRAVQNQKDIIDSMKSVIGNEFIKQTGKINGYLDEIEFLIDKNKEYISEIRKLSNIEPPKIRRSAIAQKHVFRYYVGGKPRTLLPYMSGDATSSSYLYPAVMGLTQYSKGVNIFPSIAKGWDISTDGKTITFDLRQDVRFHNGKPLTAEDVEFTLYKIASSSNYFQIVHIKGVEDYYNKNSSEIAGINVINKYTIKIELVRPYMPIFQNLAVASLGIVPLNEDIYIKNDMKARKVVSCGPFKTVEFNDDFIKYESFKDFFAGQSFIDKLVAYVKLGENQKTYDMFVNGELDYIDLSGKNLKKISEDKKYVPFVVKTYDISTQYLGFNMKTEGPFKNKLLRMAAAYIVDRERYLKDVMKSVSIPAKGIFPPSMAVYNQKLKGYYYDEERAISLARQAGFGPGTKEKAVITMSGTEKEAQDRYKFFREAFLKIGIELELKVYPWAKFLERVHRGQSEVFTLGWSADTADPDNFLFPLFYSKNKGEPGNTFYYENKKVDKLILDGMAERDPVKRIRIYRDAEKMILEDAPLIPLSYGLNYGIFQPYVKNTFLHPLSIFRPNYFWYDK
ncbi:MAG: hypothetical protein GWP03_00915 [Proteobacteria bacterium]|nr:hypothetical protein [Pseudomonadota bacterium]